MLGDRLLLRTENNGTRPYLRNSLAACSRLLE